MLTAPTEQPAPLSVADLLGAVPPAPPVTSAAAPGAPQPAAASPLLDDSGAAFDPDRHASLPDGSPRFRSGSKVRGKRLFALKRGAGGTPSAAQPTAASGAPQPAAAPDLIHPDTPAPAASAAVDESQIAAAAEQMVALEQMMALSCMGEEWAFLDAERQALVAAWARMMRERGMISTPWWVDLAAVHALLYVQRMNRPKTRDRVEVWKRRVFALWVRLRERMQRRREGSQ